MPSKGHRRSVSVRRDTWEALIAYRATVNRSASDLVEGLLRPLLGLPPVEDVRPTPKAPKPAPVKPVEVTPTLRVADRRRKAVIAEVAKAQAAGHPPVRAALPSREKVDQVLAPEPASIPVRSTGTVLL